MADRALLEKKKVASVNAVPTMSPVMKTRMA